ncbi:hypothetical protein, partial [Butyrivibrio sp. VCD2006]|uniref:hypothetical protein n=1 Tax=Butyrivibrio sp. VCD2006 TaxID=1280664 RepID=UPI00047A6FB7
MSSKKLLVRASYAVSADLNATAGCQKNEEDLCLNEKITKQNGKLNSVPRGFYAFRAMLLMMLALFVFIMFPGKATTVKAVERTPYTVTEDSTIGADVFRNSVFYTEVVIKNGATATVNGNVTATIPVTIEDEGKLIVNGNYTQQSETFAPNGIDAEVEIGGNFSVINSGRIYNTNNTTTVSIDGDYLYNSTNSVQWNVAKWRIGGNVTHSTVKDGGTFFDKLYLTGNQKQILSLKSDTSIGALYMDNENNKELDVPANLNAVICSDVDITAGANTVINKMVIDTDKEVNFNGDLTAVGPVGTKDRSKLHVTGDYTQKSEILSLNGV